MARASTPYFQKLKDPRWQRKRLEVLQSHDFTCQVCGDAQSTLHVHHKQYIKGREPWEYEASQLATVCETCHSEGHAEEDALHLVTSYLPLDGPHSRASIALLVAGYCDLSHPIVDDIYAYEASMVGTIADRLFSGRTEAELLAILRATQTYDCAEAIFRSLLANAAAQA